MPEKKGKPEMVQLLEISRQFQGYLDPRFREQVNAKILHARDQLRQALQNVGVEVRLVNGYDGNPVSDQIDAALPDRHEKRQIRTRIHIDTERSNTYYRGSTIYFKYHSARRDSYQNTIRKERKGGMFPFAQFAEEIRSHLLSAEKYNRAKDEEADVAARRKARANHKVGYLREQYGLGIYGPTIIDSDDGESFNLKMIGLSQEDLEKILALFR
jgi:hypothetical protein